MRLQALNTVTTQHKPELDAAESTAERELPVAVVDNGTRVALLRAEVSLDVSFQNLVIAALRTHRRDVERLGQIAALADEEERYGC